MAKHNSLDAVEAVGLVPLTSRTEALVLAVRKEGCAVIQVRVFQQAADAADRPWAPLGPALIIPLDQVEILAELLTEAVHRAKRLQLLPGEM